MNEEKIGQGLIVLIPLLMGTMLMIAPVARRRFLMFSVRVQPEWPDSHVARSIVRSYRLQVGILSLVAIVPGYWGLHSGSGWMIALGPLLLLFGSVLALIRGRKATLPFADQHPSVRSASLETVPLPGVNPIHGAIPFVILGAVAYWLKEHWDAIPARFPTHWDLSGKANGWSQRTPGGVYMPLCIGASICLVMIVASLAVTYGSPQPGGGKKTVHWQTLRLLRRMGYLMGLLFAFIGLGPLYPEYVLPGWLTPIILGVIGVLIIPVIRASSDPEGSEAEKTPDEAWKYGLIYYNPGDPALMVEKRMGFGYTFNFGHPLSWLLAGATVAISVVVIVFKM